MVKITSYDPVTRIDSARTLVGKGYYWTTAYLVEGLLIDSGCAHTAQELLQALQGFPLERVVNTHTHEDHIGADGILQERNPGLPIYAHPLALPVLADPRKEQPLHPYRRFFWGWPKACQAAALQEDEWIETQNYRFQVIYTPGHSPDHLCLYEPQQGWLFSGDLFIGGKDRGLRAECDIWGVIASLKRIAALPLTRLFPGCARVRENPQQELAAKIDYLEEMGQQVSELYREGIPPAQIARKLFGGPLWIELVTLGHFTRRNLVQSYLSRQ